jgi:two-component system response regulator FixJ
MTWTRRVPGKREIKDETICTVTAKRKIYVVDDDSMIRRSLSFSLGTAGYDVRPFAGGGDFLAELDYLEPGCVLLDLRMPGMDGIAVLNGLREHAENFPTVVMTGNGDVASAVTAMRTGAQDFIEKPFADEVLLSTLKTSLDKLTGDVGISKQRSAVAESIGSLSCRELEVLQGLVSGFPNKIIADRLGLSIRTVEMHRARMMTRLCSSSLAEVLQLAFLAGVKPMT